MDTDLTSKTTKNGRFLFLIMPLSALFIVTFSVLSCFPSTNYYPTLSSVTKQLTSHLHTPKILPTQTAVLHYCDGALYQDLCVSTLTRISPDISSKSLPEIISAAVNETISQVQSIDNNVVNRHLESRALEDCHALFLETISQLKNVVSYLSNARKFDDVQTLLSSAMTNLDTCLDGFEGSTSQEVGQEFHNTVKGISHQVSISLALLKKANQTSQIGAVVEHNDKSDMSL
uniref:pectinesterase inhibitor 6-like n=1 Tax=Erigeron canadensis TaxID=72917 RepID=UPI001CB963F1|nr:pectinesterase inhibitor 6-like [Erigeron canadensis]